ncbi:hypothetical protein D3C78_1843340 [compost metagenome]
MAKVALHNGNAALRLARRNVNHTERASHHAVFTAYAGGFIEGNVIRPLNQGRRWAHGNTRRIFTLVAHHR